MSHHLGTRVGAGSSLLVAFLEFSYIFDRILPVFVRYQVQLFVITVAFHVRYEPDCVFYARVQSTDFCVSSFSW